MAIETHLLTESTATGSYWDLLPTTDPGDGSNYKDRYFFGGAYQVYTSINAWHTGRNGRKNLKTELTLEIQGAWTNSGTTYNAYQSITGFYSVTITSKVNGLYDSGSYHGGVIGGGFVLAFSSATSSAPINFSNLNTVVDGIEIDYPTGTAVPTNAATVSNCIIHSYGVTNGYLLAAVSKIYNNIFIGGGGATGSGITVQNYFTSNGAIAYNNLVTGFAKGFNCLISGGFVTLIGNISIGNTTNWDLTYVPGSSYMANNAGVSGDTPWTLAGEASITTLATTDFTNFAGNDFTYVTGSPLIDSGVRSFSSMEAYAINNVNSPNGDPRPSYNNGGVEAWDIGPFEYDNGFGLAPMSQTFIINGITANSRVKITNTTDNTEIYNDIPAATTLTVTTTFSIDKAYRLDVRTGSTAPFYYTYTETGTYYAVGGQSRTITLIPDIARGATYRAGIADDWDAETLRHVAGTTVDTVQDLYSYLCDYYDDAATIDLPIPMYGTTSKIFGTQNGFSVLDVDMEYLNGGSIQDGTTLWPNIYTVGDQQAGTTVNIYVDGTEVTPWWGTGNIDIIIPFVSYTGSELVELRVREYTDSYDYWAMTVTNGRNVAALTTFDDINNQTASATVATWTDITYTVVPVVGYQIDGSDTAADYTGTIDCNNRPVSEVYEYGKYLDQYPSVYDGLSTFAHVKQAPHGTFSGGVYSVAQGWQLINVPSADTRNYILTDNAGLTHQAAAPLGYQSVTISGGVAGSIIQVRDMTAGTDLYLGTPSVWPHVWEDTVPYAADRQIRLRAMYCVGTTAYKFVDQIIGTSTSATPALTFLMAQELDTIYNDNAIDGSTVAGISIDDAHLLVNVTVGGITWPQLYAYETYWLSTAAGIIDEGRYTVAIDIANYIWYNFNIKNISSPSVPLKITGGYGYDSTGDPMGLIDFTGGSIFAAPPHVVSKVVTVGGANVITGDITDVAVQVQTGLTAQGFTAIRAPLLDHLDADVSGAVAPTVTQIREEMDTNSTKLANLDASISSRSTYSGGAVESVTSGVTVTTNKDKTGYYLTVEPPTLTDIEASTVLAKEASVAAIPTDNNVNIISVAGVAVNGTGTESDPWGP